jgi:hypothetical protein
MGDREMNLQIATFSKDANFFVKKHRTFNIEHPTSNQPETLDSFDVGCWMLNACSRFIGVECWFDSLPRQPKVQP